MKPAIFLDRDGVIIENRNNYVREWMDVAIYPQALKALVDFAHAPYYFVMVTNQSVIGRGIISRQKADNINKSLVSGIQGADGRIDAVYMCPHVPLNNCECRKPKPGMVLRAAEDLNIDLENSIMIGDALTDLEVGRNAGIKKRGLILTGRGKQQSKIKSLFSYSVHENLYEAFTYLLRDQVL